MDYCIAREYKKPGLSHFGRPIYDMDSDFYRSTIGTGYISSSRNCAKCLKRV